MKPKIDYSVYLVTDRNLMSTETLELAVEQAILGGCTLVQLREKELPTNEFYNLACSIKRLTDKYDVPLIINDRIDIALAVDADGVHIGVDDMPIAVAREMIGKNKILGVSARTVKEAVIAESYGADYIGVGAMFATTTKNNAVLVTRDELINIRASTTLPIVVIGGISKERISYFDGIDIDGLSVVSAIIAAKNIKDETQKLKQLFAARRSADNRLRFDGIECAIFDLDGTLFNSNDLWEKIDIEFLSKRGYNVPADYIVKVSALNFREAALYTKKLFNLPETTTELINEWRNMALYEYKHNIPLKPCAKDYLLALKKQGLRLGIATSLPPSLFIPALKNNEIYDLFDCCCTAENSERGKEYPDFFNATICEMQSVPERCIFFEDVLSAIKSIKQTGAKACAVYDYYSREDIPEILSVADCLIMSFSKAPLLYGKK